MPVGFGIGVVGFLFGGEGVLLRLPVPESGGFLRGVVRVVRHSVADDFAVLEVDYARAVFLGKLPVVGDHYDETVARDLLEQFHNAHAGLAVEGARRLVREDDFGIVDDCAGDCDALHLSAGKLVGLLLRLLLEPHFPEGLKGARPALLLADARERQAERDILQNADMRD